MAKISPITRVAGVAIIFLDSGRQILPTEVRLFEGVKSSCQIEIEHLRQVLGQNQLNSLKQSMQNSYLASPENAEVTVNFEFLFN